MHVVDPGAADSTLAVDHVVSPLVGSPAGIRPEAWEIPKHAKQCTGVVAMSLHKRDI
jgi:hypothetical protein